jgi:hypothetical protein
LRPFQGRNVDLAHLQHPSRACVPFAMHRKWTPVSRFPVTTGLRCVGSVLENAEAISFDLLMPA